MDHEEVEYIKNHEPILKIATVCQICEKVENTESFGEYVFPVCGRCKRVLKELILAREL